MSIEISAVVCTYNRAAMLSGALESLAQQTLDKALYEIIVVDNASTDNTPQIVEEFGQRHPGCCLRLIHEPQQGLGYARNTGFRHAKGSYVAFMDDDARASEEWLEIALACFEDLKPSPIGVGGPILPFYECPKPAWFKDEYEIRTWGDVPRFLTRGESFSGANMIFRREAIETYGGFDVRVGMRGDDLSAGEETSLYENIWRAGGDDCVLHYSPQLLVFHAVPAHKMTVSYRLKRSFAWGQSGALRRRPMPLRQRLSRVKVTLFSIARHSRSALACVRRHPAIPNWMVENVTPIAAGVGELAACLGLIIRVRERRRGGD